MDNQGEGIGKLRIVRGTVVSDKMDKSFVMEVKRRIKHKLYGKYITRCTKFHVHDEDNHCRTGDEVEVVSCRPLSKTKAFRLHRNLSAEILPDSAT